MRVGITVSSRRQQRDDAPGDRRHAELCAQRNVGALTKPRCAPRSAKPPPPDPCSRGSSRKRPTNMPAWSRRAPTIIACDCRNGEALLGDKQYAAACAEFEKLRDIAVGPARSWSAGGARVPVERGPGGSGRVAEYDSGAVSAGVDRPGPAVRGAEGPSGFPGTVHAQVGRLFRRCCRPAAEFLPAAGVCHSGHRHVALDTATARSP